MKHRVLIMLSIYFLSSIMFYSCGQDVECREEINLLPMYGKVQKCKEQLKADGEFLALWDKEEPDRTMAAIRVMDSGWYYLHRGEYDTAMKRVNQAWLLDSTNIAIYASFAVLLDLTQKTDEAIKMLELTFDRIKARKDPETPTNMNPSNEMFIEFIVSNTPFTYKKTGNPDLGKYLYTKLDSLDISESRRTQLKTRLETEIAEIN